MIEDEIFKSITPLRKSMYEKGEFSVTCGLCGEEVTEFYVMKDLGELELELDNGTVCIICKDCYDGLDD